MKITFKKMELRNFLSYGNSITTIDFNYPGLISLTGNNGTGKCQRFNTEININITEKTVRQDFENFMKEANVDKD